MATDYEAAVVAQISGMEERREKLQSELARLDGHIEGLREALALFVGEPRTRRISARTERRETRTPDPQKSPAWARVLEVLETSGSSGVGIDEIDSALKSSGFNMARNTLRANLSNAAADGIIERMRRGFYRTRRPENGDHAAPHDHRAPEAEIGLPLGDAGVSDLNGHPGH